MKIRFVIAIASIAALSGCSAQPQAHTAAPISDTWPPDLSAQQVRILTPDECKAILIARAALEDHGKEIHAHFTAERHAGDWTVNAFFTTPSGFVELPGNFAVVVIAADWTIKRVTGGA